jgi:hypothetical protein
LLVRRCEFDLERLVVFATPGGTHAKARNAQNARGLPRRPGAGSTLLWMVIHDGDLLLISERRVAVETDVKNQQSRLTLLHLIYRLPNSQDLCSHN